MISKVVNKDLVSNAMFVPRIGPFLGMAFFTGLLYLFLIVISADNTITASAARCTIVGSEPSGDRVTVNVDCDVNGSVSRYGVSAPTDVIALLSSTSKNASCDVYKLGRARDCRPVD